MFLKSNLILFILVFCSTFAFTESPYQQLLSKHVKNSKVNYVAIKKDVAELNKIIDQYKTVNPQTMTLLQKKAFWINAYNACTLKLIVDYFPLKSINDIPKSKRWDHVRWNINGKNYSLNDMEHKILRKMGDPRIHFAINCASYSCPDLSSEEYSAISLDKQLEHAKNHFFSNTKKGVLLKTESSFFGGKSKVLYLSPIFKWFSVDFNEHSGSVEKYIRKNANSPLTENLKKSPSIKIKWLDYDWSLNK